MRFNRQNYQELWITLASNEVLGILDSDYLEDYFGVDGQVSLYNVGTDTRYDVAMNEVSTETPSIPHDVFRGFVPLLGLPNGEYVVQGRVRDVVNNYTVLNAVQNPFGNERVLDLTIELTNIGVVIPLGQTEITVGLTFLAPIIKVLSYDSAIIRNPLVSGIIFRTAEFAALIETAVFDAPIVRSVALN